MAHVEDTLRQLLNKIATEQQYRNPDITINETSSGGANYTSRLFTVIVREDNKDDLHLFAKVATVGKKYREEVPLSIFDTERYAYTNLLKTYESLEKQNAVPEEHRLSFTKCYGIDPTLFQETVVMENLLSQGFGPYNRLEPMQWNYASSAVTEMAKMHALSFAYRKAYPEKYESDLRRFKTVWREGLLDRMRESSVAMALNAVKPEYRELLKKFSETYMKDLLVKFTNPDGGTSNGIIVHGDFRGNNLLHRVREDGKMDIKIVDLQTLQGGSPVTDLIYFIFTGSDEQFRARHFDQLVEHYYTQLCEAMKRLHLDPEETFPREEFDSEMKDILPFGLTLAMFILPMVTVAEENAPVVDDDLEVSDFSSVTTSELYVERLNGVVSDFVMWGILK